MIRMYYTRQLFINKPIQNSLLIYFHPLFSHLESNFRSKRLHENCVFPYQHCSCKSSLEWKVTGQSGWMWGSLTERESCPRNSTPRAQTGFLFFSSSSTCARKAMKLQDYVKYLMCVIPACLGHVFNAVSSKLFSRYCSFENLFWYFDAFYEFL